MSNELCITNRTVNYNVYFFQSLDVYYTKRHNVIIYFTLDKYTNVHSNINIFLITLRVLGNDVLSEKYYVTCEGKTKLSHFEICTLIIDKHLVRLLLLLVFLKNDGDTHFIHYRILYDNSKNIFFLWINEYCEQLILFLLFSYPLFMSMRIVFQLEEES